MAVVGILWYYRPRIFETVGWGIAVLLGLLAIVMSNYSFAILFVFAFSMLVLCRLPKRGGPTTAILLICALAAIVVLPNLYRIFYFIAENTALGITLASNVSLLICTAPIFTLFLSRLFYKERLRRKVLYGSLIALIGVGMVVLNGSLVLKINPLGDFLTLIAAIFWALYCLILKQLGGRYSTLFVTRKVFFYGLVSLLAYLCFFPTDFALPLLHKPVVYLNLLFLGIVASMLCYMVWNAAVQVLGASQTANYIYINPLVTLLTSALFLSETLTPVSLLGTACIIGGVYMAER